MGRETIFERRTDCPERTAEAGAELARWLIGRGGGAFVAIYGELGAGKTAFVAGFAEAWAPEAVARSPIHSPTFTIVEEYGGTQASRRLIHMDLFRINTARDLYSVGFDEYMEQVERPAGGVATACCAEFAQRFDSPELAPLLPQRHVRVEITAWADGCRNISADVV